MIVEGVRALTVEDVAIALARVAPPVVGVLAFGWSVYDTVAYWFVESAVVGLVNVPRILVSRGAPSPEEQPPDATGWSSAAFFVAHYGFFLFVQVWLLDGWLDGRLAPLAFVSRPEALRDAAICGVIEVADLVWRGFWRGDRHRRSPTAQMFAPYPRVVVQQATVLFGVWGAALAGLWAPGAAPLGLFAVWVGARLVVDLAVARASGRSAAV